MTKEIEDLFDFYVIKCPVNYKQGKQEKFISKQGIYFSKLKYDKVKITKILKEIKEIFNDNIIWCNKEVDGKAAEIEIKEKRNYSDENFEYVAIVENTNMGKTKSIFYMIRNALAHGDFLVEGEKITLVSTKDNKVKMKMRVNIDNLFEIKKIYLKKEFKEKELKNGKKRNKRSIRK